jgi:transposase-like protein
MNEATIIGLLGQVTSGEIKEELEKAARGVVRDLFLRVLEAEVAELCGPAYERGKERECYRSGSAPGSVALSEKREKITRPRARRRLEGGGSEEVRLGIYEAGKDAASLREGIVTALAAGVSTREQERLGKGQGVKKSEASRLWAREGVRLVEELRGRDLGGERWLVLMLDGIYLAKELLAVVALGVTDEGKKVILDFELGASENAEVCSALLSRVRRRGFGPIEGHRLLAVLDGSEALKKAATTHFPGIVLQRCLVHKLRNLEGYVRKGERGELRRYFDRLRKVEGEEAAREALDELERFLEGTNARALESLREAGDELIALHKLGVPSTLNVSLLSTNLIENPFKNVRRKIGRVTRWRPETGQPSRWLAHALLEAERGFRRIRGHADLGALKEALRLPDKGGAGRSDNAGVPPLRASPSAPGPQR